MAEFQPILISAADTVLEYREGQFITATQPFKDAENNTYPVGVFIDLAGQRQQITTQGVKGDIGEKGDTGPRGETGATGAAGPKGETGSRGATGPMGPQGVQGIQGTRGTQGIEGPPGKPGNIRHWYTSIAELEADFSNPDIAQYDLAAVNSNDTAEDGRMYYKGAGAWVYVTTFKGVEGPQGKQGEQGVQGLQGPAGPGFRWMGAWSEIAAGTQLVPGDVVLDLTGGGNTFINILGCAKASDSSLPSVDGEHWALYLPRPEIGEEGMAEIVRLDEVKLNISDAIQSANLSHKALDVVDLNDVTYTYIGGVNHYCTNRPSGSHDGFLMSIQYDNRKYIAQIYISSGDDTVVKKVWWRINLHYANNDWTDWQPFFSGGQRVTPADSVIFRDADFKRLGAGKYLTGPYGIDGLSSFEHSALEVERDGEDYYVTAKNRAGETATTGILNNGTRLPWKRLFYTDDPSVDLKDTVTTDHTGVDGVKYYTNRDVGTVTIDSGTHVFTNCEGSVTVSGNAAKVYVNNSPGLTVYGVTSENWRNIVVDGVAQWVALNSVKTFSLSQLTSGAMLVPVTGAAPQEGDEIVLDYWVNMADWSATQNTDLFMIETYDRRHAIYANLGISAGSARTSEMGVILAYEPDGLKVHENGWSNFSGEVTLRLNRIIWRRQK